MIVILHCHNLRHLHILPIFLYLSLYHLLDFLHYLYLLLLLLHFLLLLMFHFLILLLSILILLYNLGSYHLLHLYILLFYQMLLLSLLHLLLLLLLFLSAFYGRNLNSLLLVLMIFCIACCGVSLLCSLFPQTVTYPEGIPSLLTASSFPWIASVFLMILLLAIRKWSDKAFFSKILRFFSLIFLFLIAMSGIIFLALLVKNTLSPGSIGFLSRYSVFTFTPEWGSKRGATWRAGFLCFAEQPLLKKLIGIGPDCMGIYTLQDAGLPIKELLQAQFSGLTLTNTHNEWLTILLNLGILGLCGFMGMTGSACFRFFCCGIKGHGKYSHFIGACGMCVFAYTVHNLFSFQQITNVTLLFLLLGIGENCRKAEESPSPSP